MSAAGHLHSVPWTLCAALPYARPMEPTCIRRLDREHVLLPNGWVARVPLAPPCRSLQINSLNEATKQALRAAAGSGVELIL